jgi:hypothetical protein
MVFLSPAVVIVMRNACLEVLLETCILHDKSITKMAAPEPGSKYAATLCVVCPGVGHVSGTLQTQDIKLWQGNANSCVGTRFSA